MNLFYFDSPFTLQRNQIRSSSNANKKERRLLFLKKTSFWCPFSLFRYQLKTQIGVIFVLISSLSSLECLHLFFSQSISLGFISSGCLFVWLSSSPIWSRAGQLFHFCTILLTFWPSLDERFWTLISCFYSFFLSVVT